MALGSNLGARASHLADAVERIRAYVSDVRVSRVHDTAYVGGLDEPQPRYLNAALVGTTDLSAPDLLAALLATERELGRERPFQDAPRTVDLDLILYGASVIHQSGLSIPHPRFRERLFVLEPLAEIAGDWVDPVTGRTVSELLAACLRAHGRDE